MAWPKQFGGGSQMSSTFVLMVNGFCFKPIKDEQEYLKWAENISKELNLKILNAYYKKNKIFVVFENGFFSLKLTEKNSTEAEFEMNYDYPINVDLVLKNLEEKLCIVDPCHILVRKNFYFTIEKAEGLHLKNESIVWIN